MVFKYFRFVGNVAISGCPQLVIPSVTGAGRQQIPVGLTEQTSARVLLEGPCSHLTATARAGAVYNSHLRLSVQLFIDISIDKTCINSEVAE